MQDYQRQFIEFAMKHEVLCFGEFTLKSGRISPYFFNAGKFNSGAAVSELGHCYAAALQASGIEFDLLFGPAYKGIPLATTTAVAFARDFDRDVPFCFNRKMKKDYGDAGIMVGAPLSGRVVVVDDVVTAGTTIREVVNLLAGTEAELVGVVTALDRSERGQTDKTATQELSDEFGVAFTSIISLEHVIAYLAEQPQMANELERLRQYQAKYGVDS